VCNDGATGGERHGRVGEVDRYVLRLGQLLLLALLDELGGRVDVLPLAGHAANPMISGPSGLPDGRLWRAPSIL
jgi:hypothetical protein